MGLREKFNSFDTIDKYFCVIAAAMYICYSAMFFLGVVLSSNFLMIFGGLGIFIAGWVLMDLFEVDI